MSYLIRAGLVAMLLVASTVANAALIRITPTGVASNAQAVTDPVPIGADGFRLTYHSEGGGNDAIIDPLTLIIGTPTGSAAPTVADGTSQNPIGLTATVSSPVLVGTWNGSTANNVYDFVGLAPVNGGNSQNYSNWTGGAADYGMSISSWDIYTVAISFDPDLIPGYWNEFTASLAVGSYVVGWGCESIATSGRRSGSCTDAQQTPFTFAGLVTPPNSVPEPGTLVLLGTGLLGLGLMRRKRTG